MKTILLLLITFFLFSSCVSTRQYVEYSHLEPIKKDLKARIYIIRPFYVSVAVQSSIFCNNNLVGNTGGNGFICWDVKPGKYEIAATQRVRKNATIGTAIGDDLFVINAKAGEIYYLYQNVGFYGGFRFKLLEKEKGENLVRNKKSPKINFL